MSTIYELGNAIRGRRTETGVDLCAIATRRARADAGGMAFLGAAGAAFLQALAEHEDVVRREFAEIDVIGEAMDFR